MKKIALFIAALIYPTILFAGGAGLTGGDILLRPASARSSALGEAFAGATNDISAMAYNPASLKTLQNGQSILMYQKGIAEDTFGQFMIGAPVRGWGLGLSAGYYNGGEINLFDGISEKTVTSKVDLVTAVGAGINWGQVNFGVTGKYISSELAESYKSTAYAGDVGFQYVGARFQFGGAFQNFGSKLGDADLPRVVRAGMGVSLFKNSYPTVFLLETPYYLSDESFESKAGIETRVGALALRAGYKSGSGLSSTFFGAGFNLNSMSVDYSYAMFQDFKADHWISLGFQFGKNGENDNVSSLVSAPKPVEMTPPALINFAQEKPARIYTVKQGDSFGKIAKAVYGDSQMWVHIFKANQHLLGDSQTLEVGQRIVLP